MKSFLGNFYRHLAIFSGYTTLTLCMCSLLISYSLSVKHIPIILHALRYSRIHKLIYLLCHKQLYTHIYLTTHTHTHTGKQTHTHTHRCGQVHTYTHTHLFAERVGYLCTYLGACVCMHVKNGFILRMYDM